MISFDDIQAWVQLSARGDVVYDSRLLRILTPAEQGRLHSCIEDEIYEEDGEDCIDWPKVQQAYDRMKPADRIGHKAATNGQG